MIGSLTIPKRLQEMCLCSVLQSESYQEDIYPMTAGNKPAMTADEWISGLDKGQRVLNDFSVIIISYPPTNLGCISRKHR